ncbi:MAG: lysylphosphatidylglycerol synthase transmembrane domain-containing protein [Bacteroidota bacterium]
MNTSLKKIIQYAIIIAVGGGFMYYVFKNQDWAELWSKISSANLLWLGIGMSVSVFSHWLRAYRAILMYDAMNYKIKTDNSFYAVIIGYMMNYFIPRAGEVARCASLNKSDNLPIEKSLGSVITERLFDLLIMVFLLALVFFIQFDLIWGFIQKTIATNQTASTGTLPLKWIVLGLLVATSAFIYLLRHKIKSLAIYNKIASLLKGFMDGLLSIKNVKQPVLFVFLSFGIWACYILMMYCCFFALVSTSSLSFTACLTVFAIGTIGVALPAPGAGAGTYHYFISQSLLLFGVAEADGVAYATMVHGAQMILIIVLGLLSSLILLLKKKAQ